MAEISYFWDGVATGDATLAPYDAPTEFAAYMRALCGADSLYSLNRGGVVFGYNEELEPFVFGAASPAYVDVGRAIVDGNWYENSVPTTTVIPTPAVATRIDRIVLRKDWVLQTIRITRIAGVEGGAAPALVQTPGVTWDIPIMQVSITTGGVCTVTDEREYVAIMNRPLCAIFSATAPSQAGATGTILTYDGELSDNYNMHDNVTLNTRITVPKNGIYRIIAPIGFNAGQGGTYRELRVGRNGLFGSGGVGPPMVGAQLLYRASYTTAIVNTSIYQAQTTVYLLRGDYIEMQMLHDTGGSATAQVGAINGFFSAEWIAAR